MMVPAVRAPRTAMPTEPPMPAEPEACAVMLPNVTGFTVKSNEMT